LNTLWKNRLLLWKNFRRPARTNMAQNAAERNGFSCSGSALFAWHRKAFRVEKRELRAGFPAPCQSEKFFLVSPQIAHPSRGHLSVKKSLREHLSASCTEQELKRWFDPLDIELSADGREVRVGFPHAFFAQWFAGRMQDRFEAELFRFRGEPCDIRYLAPAGSRGRFQAAGGDGATANGQAEKGARKLAFPFDAQYNFESFLTNSKNYFPLETARQVARAEGAQFNPFVICGKSGSGKSHLLKAIANEIAKTRSAADLLVTTGEGLRTVFAGADQLAAREQVGRHRFLLVDDIHSLAGDERLQQELLVLFNNFQDQRRQMVFTCQDRIGAWEELIPSLRSRLEGGLVVEIGRASCRERVS
jgi:chromosomal replication initiator protein